MVRVVRNTTAFLTAFIAWIAFFPLAFALDNDDLFAFVNSLTVGSGFTVLYAYWPGIKYAFTHYKSEFDYADFLSFGIFVTWIGIIGWLSYTIVLRLNFAPPSEWYSVNLAFLQYIIFTGAMLHLSARRVIRNQVPRSSIPMVVIGIGSGCLLGVILTLTN